jgi:Zn-dependent protease
MTIVTIVIYILILLFSVVLHEVSHGKVADELGDPTARLAGRLTLNPIPHLDMFGSIIVPLVLIFSGSGFLIAWAKPVPIDPYNLKNPRKDSALISLAGPATNLFLAIISSILLYLFNFLNISLLSIIGPILVIIIRLNIILAIFNLIPIAPLDGFKIVEGILSDEKAHEWNQLQKYGTIFFLILIFPLFNGSSMINFILNPIVSFILKLLIPFNLNGGII